MAANLAASYLNAMFRIIVSQAGTQEYENNLYSSCVVMSFSSALAVFLTIFVERKGYFSLRLETHCCQHVLYLNKFIEIICFVFILQCCFDSYEICVSTDNVFLLF